MSVPRIIRATKQPKKIFRLASYKLLGMLGGMEFSPFIVLTEARTGSNLLISMLDSHPNVRAEGELFRDLDRKFYPVALNIAFSKQPSHIRASGFKIFYHHTSEDGFGGVWARLQHMENLLVIHLKRKNVLRAVTSLRIASTQGIWLESSSDRRENLDKKVSFSVDELEQHFRRIRTQQQWGDRTFSGRPMMNVYYEDLVDRSEVVFGQLTRFLGVPFSPPLTALIRQNPEELRDLIVNYDYLKSKFAGTEWQDYFED